MLHFLGATINAIIVAGLVLGIVIVIDDVIVGVDEIVRRLRHPDEADAGKSAMAIIVEAVVEGRGATTYALLILMLALVPLFLMSGIAGAFLPPLVVAYLVAILASTLVALTVTPALAALLLPEVQSPHRRTVVTQRVKHAYASLLSNVLRRTRTVFAVVAVVTIGVIALGGALAVTDSDGAFVPPFKERDVLIHWDGAPGTSSVEMNRIVARAGAELRTVPGIRNVGGHVGRAVTSDQVVSINAAELWVSIDPATDYDTALAAIQDVIAGYPGLRRTVQTYTSDRIDKVLGGAEEDVVVRVYGQEADVLRSKAAEVSESLAGIDGLADVAVAAQIDEPTLMIQVDLAAAERVGLKPGDVRRAATTMLSGLEVGFIFEEQKVFEVVVWGAPELRNSLTSIKELPIQTPVGTYVPLGEIANVSIEPSPSIVQREGVFRFVDVAGSVEGRDLGAVLADVDSRLAAIEFPLEYRAEVMGAAIDRQATLTRLLAVSAAVLIGILLLLQAAFGSWRRAVVLLVTLPSALVGAAIGAIVADGFVSISVVAGFIAVFAIAVRHGILMVDRCKRLERAPGAAFGSDLILRAAEERLAPVLATTVAAGLAMAPFIVLGTLPGYEIVRPMALVVLGGLATSTIFALFVVPAVVIRTGPSPEPDAAAQLVEQPGLSPA